MKSPEEEWPPVKRRPQPLAGKSQFKPPVAQLKNPVSARSIKRPVAPLPYTPNAKPLVAQRKVAQSTPSSGPRVYRPQPVPKCLQLKAATPRQQLAKESKLLSPRPPVHRPQLAPTTLQPKLGHQSARTKFERPQLQPNAARPTATKPSQALQRHTPAMTKTPFTARGSARANTIQRYLLINLERGSGDDRKGSKHFFTYEFPPDKDDLRLGCNAVYEQLSQAQVTRVLAALKNWGRGPHVEFRSWEAAVAAGLVWQPGPAAAAAAAAADSDDSEEDSDGDAPAEAPVEKKSDGLEKKSDGLKWVWNSDKTWQHTFKKHGAKQKQRLTQVAKIKDKGKQGMWVNNAKAAVFLQSIRGKLGDEPANVPLPAGLGIEILPDGKTQEVTRAIVIPCSWSGGYTTAYPTSDVTIKGGKVFASI